MFNSYSTMDAANFLNGRGPDAIGRTVEDYLKFDKDKWEECHNHVQWAFPSHIGSAFNPDAPIVDMRDLAATLSVEGYQNIDLLMGNYLESLGITMANNEFVWDVTSPQNAIWITPRNHNFLRISRLLNLLHYINPIAADNLLNTFLDITMVMSKEFDRDNPISTETVVYWSKAAIGKL